MFEAIINYFAEQQPSSESTRWPWCLPTTGNAARVQCCRAQAHHDGRTPIATLRAYSFFLLCNCVSLNPGDDRGDELQVNFIGLRGDDTKVSTVFHERPFLILSFFLMWREIHEISYLWWVIHLSVLAHTEAITRICVSDIATETNVCRFSVDQARSYQGGGVRSSRHSRRSQNGSGQSDEQRYIVALWESKWFCVSSSRDCGRREI